MVGDVRYIRFTDTEGEIHIVKFDAIKQAIKWSKIDEYEFDIGDSEDGKIKITEDTFNYFQKLAGFDN